MTAYIFIANGFEDIEALGTADILLRAGVQTVLVGIEDGQREYTSSHGLVVKVDSCGVQKIECDENDALIFPGGMPGSSNLASCGPLTGLLRRHYERGGFVAAICAAPALVLAPNIDVKGLEVTCYPSMEQPLIDAGGDYLERTVCVADTRFGGVLVTASGPGLTFDFALNIVQELKGEEVADKVASGMLLM